MRSVGILVGPGRRGFDVAVAREVFDDRSDRGVPRADVRLLSAHAESPLDEHTTVRRTAPLAAVTEVDLLVVPGTETPLRGPDPEEVGAVARAAAAGVTVASLCTGAFTLAAAGLLDGRAATTHWRFADDLARAHPRIEVRPRDLYCGGEGVWTSAGVAAGVDLLLHLVRTRWGAAAAATIARSMVTPAFRPGSQAQYVETEYRTVPSATVEQLDRLVGSDLRRAWTVAALAEAWGMSPRTFHRRFAEQVGTSPIGWLNDLRVREAQRLLEQTDLSITAVAHAVGFGSDDLLRKHFGARLRTSPSRHRDTFRAR